MPPWDAEFQKGERRAQPGAVGACLEEWGCSGDEGLQNICSKDKGAYSCFGGYMRESTSINWMKLKGESWEIFIFNRVQITLALCILKHECKVSFNSPSHICGYRQLEECPFAYLCVRENDGVKKMHSHHLWLVWGMWEGIWLSILG